MPVDENVAAEITAAIDASVKESKVEEENVEVTKEETNGDEVQAVGDEAVQAGGEDAEGGVSDSDNSIEDDGTVEEDEGEVEEEEYVPDENLLNQAVMLGIPIGDAVNFPSDEALSAAINSIHRSIELANPPKQQESQEEEEPLKDFPELDPEVFEEDAIKVFGAVKEIIRKQAEKIKSLESRQVDSGRVVQAAKEKEIEQWFDTQVEKLGDEFVDTLGKGGYRSLRHGSPQLAARDAIATKMAVMLSGYRAAGLPIPAREQVFSDAISIVLKQDMKKADERKIAKQLEKRSGQHITKTASKKLKANQSPEEEIASLLDHKYFGKT